MMFSSQTVIVCVFVSIPLFLPLSDVTFRTLHVTIVCVWRNSSEGWPCREVLFVFRVATWASLPDCRPVYTDPLSYDDIFFRNSDHIKQNETVITEENFADR